MIVFKFAFACEEYCIPFATLWFSLLDVWRRTEEKASTSALSAVTAPSASTKLSRSSLKDLQSLRQRSASPARADTAATTSI